MIRLRGRITISRSIAGVLAFNGLLSLATGVAPIFQFASLFHIEKVPEYLRLSTGQRLSSIMTVFLGMVLVMLARGLYQRRRRSWGWAVFLLTVIIANSFYRGNAWQSVLLSMVLLGALLVFYRRFDVPSDSKMVGAQIFALISVLFALGYGIVGSYIMRQQFSGLQTWTDAIYYTFVTYSTLGYGDILPQTENAKIFSVSMVIIGLGSFIAAMTVLVGPMMEKRMKGVLRIMSRFQNIIDHVVICGYSNVSESIIDELQQRHVAYLVVEDRQDIVLHLQNKGHDVIAGAATTTETLERANLKKARAIVAAFDSDSVNTLVALTASEYRKTSKGSAFRIIVRVEEEGNIEKVRNAGADEVISPSTIGGRLMAKRALGEAAT